MDQTGRGRGRGSDDEAEGGIDRRAFLAGAGAVVGLAALESTAQARLVTPGHNPTVVGVSPIAQLFNSSSPTVTFMLHRRDDMVALRFDGYNLVQDGQKLVRHRGAVNAHLVVTHLPQHLTEEAFPQNAAGNLAAPAPGLSRALLAYPSRLAFTLPPSLKSIPLTVAGLLDWAKLDPSLAPAAATFLNSKPPAIRAPSPTETSIELPWHLALSPLLTGTWSHTTEPRTLNGATDLWTTQLENAPAVTGPRPVRAIWNFDTNTHDFSSPGKPTLDGGLPSDSPGNNSEPFLTSLTPNDRYQIVKATSDFTLGGRADLQVDKLALSARGGFLDSTGIWDINSGPYDLAEWKHLATLGRDQYVKVVTKGFLFPFGHRVVKTVITEREFEKVGDQVVATSRQITYLVVREATKSYDPADTFGIANNSRDFPFRSLTLATLRTPDLDPTIIDFILSLNTHARLGHAKRGSRARPADVFGFQETPFVPTVGGKPFMWHFIGTDWVGREIAFTAPAVYVGQADGYDPTTSGYVNTAYNALQDNDTLYSVPIRIANLHGQRIAFGESVTPGDTDLEVQQLRFAASAGAGGTLAEFQAADQPRTYPSIAYTLGGNQIGGVAKVRLAAAEQISGGAPLNGQALPPVSYYPGYITTGFCTSAAPTANKGNVFIELLDAQTSPTNIVFSGPSSGAVMTPNFGVAGLSRSLGPVADIGDIFNGIFNPAAIFPGLSGDLAATILGGISLSSLIAPVNGGRTIVDPPYSPENPNTEALRITFHDNSTALTTELAWSPQIVSNTMLTPSPDGQLSFTLEAKIVNDVVNPTQSSYKIVGTLSNFVVNLNNTDDLFMSVEFDELKFTSGSGQKSIITVDVHPNGVSFFGPLAFVEKLSELMSFTGGGGPKITVTATDIEADLTVALPPIQIGLFSISNIAIDADLTLPFGAGPMLTGFGFASRDNPFTLSVAVFGGGGWFGIQFGAGEVQTLDAGFEFGAACSINLGVASGSISLMAGIYYGYALDSMGDGPTSTLTGFVKLQGSLSILEIITLSLEFDLSLTYMESAGGHSVTGTATLTVGVTFLFFHASVSMTATKTFSSSGNGGVRHRSLADPSDPDMQVTFADQVKTQQMWDTYCAAFATN